MFSRLKNLSAPLCFCLAALAIGGCTSPTLTNEGPFASMLPAAAANTGGAVLIVPGGAGDDVPTLARWLSGHGMAAFVLPAGATATDTTHAVQYLRAHAVDFKISPQRIALLGYAAGADVAAEAAYNKAVEAKPDAPDPVEKFSSRPDLVALIWGSALPTATGTKFPPTFLVGSTNAGDNLPGTIELWNKLRAARSSVDAHFFAKADLKTILAADNLSVGSWPDMFFAWARFSGLLTDEPRVPVKGLVYLDGHTLPHGYVIFTPIGFVGAGPIIGRVLNSTANEPLGLFTIPASQGPVAGRYKVEVYQTMNRWLSNSFTAGLTRGNSPEQVTFGHYRRLDPTIDDMHIFSKAHPGDTNDLIVEFKPGDATNANVKIEIFSK